jgi:equilibrative nucleoside transporter 1/2/3
MSINKVEVMSSSAEPVDEGGLAYKIMFYEGLGNLLPWNAFITASAYFANRFCGTQFEYDFENYFSFTFTISQTIGLAFSILFQDKLTLNQKIIPPLICYSVIFAITTILVVFDVNSQFLFWLTLGSLVLCGFCGAVLSGGLFGLGAIFPAHHTGALMGGQGVAGLGISISSLLTIWATPENANYCDVLDDLISDSDCQDITDYSAFAYFSIATLALLSCIGAFLVLIKLPYTSYYLSRAAKPKNDNENSLHESLLKNDDNGGNDNNFSRSSTDDDLRSSNSSISDASSISNNMSNNMNKSRDDSTHVEKLSSSANIMRVFKLVMVPAISVWFAFTVTIAVFPSIIFLVQSTERCRDGNDTNRFYNDLFTPIQFLLFNLFDLIGRLIAGNTTIIFNKTTLWMASFARLAFFPLFLLCNIANSELPIVFQSDFYPILFMILFAITNGYVATSSMIMGAMSVENPVDASLAGTIMVFCLTFGLFSGACFSFVLTYISQGTV